MYSINIKLISPFPNSFKLNIEKNKKKAILKPAKRIRRPLGESSLAVAINPRPQSRRSTRSGINHSTKTEEEEERSGKDARGRADTARSRVPEKERPG